MKKVFWALAVSILLVGCSKSYKEKVRLSRAEQKELQRQDSLALKVCTTPTLDCLPVFVAQQEHLFDTLGVDVHLKQMKSHIDGDDMLKKGRAEGAFSDLIRAGKLQKDGLALDYLTVTNLGWQLFSNRKARLKRLDQLGDRMVAMTRFSATDFLTDHVLKNVKTKAMVYRVQFNDVNLRLHMLLNNEMDALWLPEPQATTARLYKNPILFDTDKEDMRLGVLVMKKQFNKDKRRQKQIKDFCKAYNNAVDSINKNGLQHYGALIKKYTGTDDMTLKALPKIKYQHITTPREQDLKHGL